MYIWGFQLSVTHNIVDFNVSVFIRNGIGYWYHFAGTHDGDALRTYINGASEGEITGVPPIDASDLYLRH
jgi:hypothetical protein